MREVDDTEETCRVRKQNGFSEPGSIRSSIREPEGRRRSLQSVFPGNEGWCVLLNDHRPRLQIESNTGYKTVPVPKPGEKSQCGVREQVASFPMPRFLDLLR